MDELFDFIRSLKNIRNCSDMITYRNIGLNMIKNIEIYDAKKEIQSLYFKIMIDDIYLSFYIQEITITINNKLIVIRLFDVDKPLAVCKIINNIDYKWRYFYSYEVEESTKMSVSDGIDWLLNQKHTKSAIN